MGPFVSDSLFGAIGCWPLRYTGSDIRRGSSRSITRESTRAPPGDSTGFVLDESKFSRPFSSHPYGFFFVVPSVSAEGRPVHGCECAPEGAQRRWKVDSRSGDPIPLCRFLFASPFWALRRLLLVPYRYRHTPFSILYPCTFTLPISRSPHVPRVQPLASMIILIDLHLVLANLLTSLRVWIFVSPRMGQRLYQGEPTMPRGCSTSYLVHPPK